MKIIFRVALLSFALFFAFSAGTYAQKLAHISANEILRVMPDMDSVQVKLEALTKELTEEMEFMQVEYNRKAEDYQANQTKWTDLVRQSKESELMQMQQRITEYRDAASEELQTKEREFLQPVYDKVLAAISAVAKEQGITYVLDSGTLLYSSADAIDLAPAVRAKLGLN